MAGPSIASAGAQSWISRISVQLAESLFAVLFPSDCRICGEPLANISRLPVCGQCLVAMHPTAGGLCAICGERIFSSYAQSAPDGAPRCGLCWRIEPPFARAVAYGSYEGGLRELIHLLKYAGVHPAANVLGRMLAEAIAELEPELPTEPVAVVPVPLHRIKLRQREFNHAERIARAAVKLGPARLRLCPRVLVRKRETPSQTGLTRHQRRENVRGAFGVAQPEAVKGREVLLVDDVYTTGATVSECARVLRRAGATKVWVATVARTMKASEQHVQIRFSGAAGTGEEAAEPEIPLARAAGI
jgi:ComF family protein